MNLVVKWDFGGGACGNVGGIGWRIKKDSIAEEKNIQARNN